MNLDYSLLKGSFTAVITPFNKDLSIDKDGFLKLLLFQKKYNNKCVVMGTTAESPTIDWYEHINAVKYAIDCLGPSGVVAGTGSNSTSEALKATGKVYDLGAKSILAVDCYYNKPSSKSLFENYYSRLAESFSDLLVIPYIIPGRSVTQLSVPHLMLLSENFDNVMAVKEASGDLERMKFTRQLAISEGLNNFSILSGDDNITYQMMSDEKIMGNGVISVYSNIFPKAVNDLVTYLSDKDYDKAKKINEDLGPLFELVGLKTVNEVRLKNKICLVENKHPNPEPVKALMNILGLPAGPCRPPLSGLDGAGLKLIKNAALKVYEKDPAYFEPLAEYFEINDVKERLKE